MQQVPDVWYPPGRHRKPPLLTSCVGVRSGADEVTALEASRANADTADEHMGR
jgi:hypothetical protein